MGSFKKHKELKTAADHLDILISERRGKRKLKVPLIQGVVIEKTLLPLVEDQERLLILLNFLIFALSTEVDLETQMNKAANAYFKLFMSKVSFIDSINFQYKLSYAMKISFDTFLKEVVRTDKIAKLNLQFMDFSLLSLFRVLPSMSRIESIRLQTLDIAFFKLLLRDKTQTKIRINCSHYTFKYLVNSQLLSVLSLKQDIVHFTYIIVEFESRVAAQFNREYLKPYLSKIAEYSTLDKDHRLFFERYKRPINALGNLNIYEVVSAFEYSGFVKFS